MGGSTKQKQTSKTNMKTSDTTNQTTTQVTGPSAATAPYYDMAYKGAGDAYAATPKTAEGIYAGPNSAQTGALDQLKNWATGDHPEIGNTSGLISKLMAGTTPLSLADLYASPTADQHASVDMMRNWATGPHPETDAVSGSLSSMQAGSQVRPQSDIWAGPNATQLSAVQGAKDWATGAHPETTNIQGSIDQINKGYQPLDTSAAINAAVTPYTNQLLERILPSSRSQAVTQGAYDGDRRDINQGQLIRDNWSSPVADVVAKYTLAEHARQAQYGLDAVNPMIAANTALTSSQLQPLSVLSQAGDTEHGWQQGSLDAMNAEKNRAGAYSLSSAPQIASSAQALQQMQQLPIAMLGAAGQQEQAWGQQALDAQVGERDKNNAYNLQATPQIAQLQQILQQLQMLPISMLGQAGGQEQSWAQAGLDASQRAPWNGLGELTSILQALPGTQTTGVQAGTNTGTQVGTGSATTTTKTPLASDIFKGLLGGAMLFSGA